MSKKLVELVNAECNANVGKYNFAKDKDARICHHNVCKMLQQVANESGFPLTILVYIGIGGDAHKPCVFEKGYKKFNEKRTKRVLKLARIFGEHFGLSETSMHNANLIHAICRYDDLFADSGKVGFFRSCVNDLPKPNGKFKMTQFKTAKDIGRFIFGDNLKYNERGYFTND